MELGTARDIVCCEPATGPQLWLGKQGKPNEQRRVTGINKRLSNETGEANACQSELSNGNEAPGEVCESCGWSAGTEKSHF